MAKSRFKEFLNISDKEETHTVAFSNFLDNNNNFSYSIYTDL